MNRAFSFGDKSIEQAVRSVNSIRRIALIGAGTMGQGIALDLLGKTDCQLVLLDISEDALQRTKVRFEGLWEKQVSTSRIRKEDAAALARRVTYSSDFADLAGVDLVWEVATERSEIKAGIFETIEKNTDSDTLLAVFSNTSSHTTAELAELFKTDAYRERFLTVHGYFPFDANRLIDVMKGKYASEEVFKFGVVFADQILEKTVIALSQDHHGYITDPLFQAMGAIISWDIKRPRDIIELGGLWELFTANPFAVLDQTGHMPYTESSRHLGSALPEDDRLRCLYLRNDKHYPDWIAKLEESGFTGVNSAARKGFFSFDDSRRPKADKVLDPASGSYVEIEEICRKEFNSYYEAAERDRRDGKIKSIDSLIFVASADDAGGHAFRRYALPLCLYALDMIQDRVATPGQINIATRAGLRFKAGLVEIIDGLVKHLTIDGLFQLIRRARDENADDPFFVDMLDVDGQSGPRLGKPCLLHEMKERHITSLLEYGKYNGTPVGELDLDTGQYHGSYLDLKFYEPSEKDRVATIVFNAPLRGNVFNRGVVDQLAHAVSRVLTMHRNGTCGSVLFSAAGKGMRMLGADAREFNRGWFERDLGYVPLTEEEAAASSRNGVGCFRIIQESPVASIGVFGENGAVVRNSPISSIFVMTSERRALSMIRFAANLNGNRQIHTINQNLISQSCQVSEQSAS